MLPAATQEELTFDKFHVMKTINEAVDEVHRQGKELPTPELKDTRYLLTGPNNVGRGPQAFGGHPAAIGLGQFQESGTSI
jgi:Transposase